MKVRARGVHPIRAMRRDEVGPIAVVDHEVLWLRPLCAVLRREARRVVVLPGIREAVHLVPEVRPTAVLVPGGITEDAVSLVTGIEARMPGGRPSVIYVSSDPGSLSREDRALFDEVLEAPLSPRMLDGILDRYQRRARRVSGVVRAVEAEDAKAGSSAR